MLREFSVTCEIEAGNDKITKRKRELARRPIMSTPIADNLNIPNDQWITASVSGTGNITGNRSQTLIANSSWSQVNGGVPFGTSFGNVVAVRNYRGGTSEIWNGYVQKKGHSTLICLHSPAQLAVNVPEVLYQLFLVLVVHGFWTSLGSVCWLSSSAEIRRSCPSFTMTKLVPV